MGFMSGDHDGLNVVEIILNKSGCIRSCIVLLQKGTPSLLNGTTTGRNTSSL